MKQLYTVLALVLALLLIAGCSDSSLTREDRKLLKKAYKDLTIDEELRLDKLQRELPEEELAKYKSDYKRLYVECMTALGLGKEEAGDMFENDWDYKLRKRQGKLTEEELAAEQAGKEPGTEQDPVKKRKAEIEAAIRDRISGGDYKAAKLDKITINENLGTEADDYIALVYFNFDRKNTRKTGNEVMRMYSDDLAASLAKKGITDVCEIAVFWRDDYNNRNVKYAYKFGNGAFRVMDIQGE